LDSLAGLESVEVKLEPFDSWNGPLLVVHYFIECSAASVIFIKLFPKSSDSRQLPSNRYQHSTDFAEGHVPFPEPSNHICIVIHASSILSPFGCLNMPNTEPNWQSVNPSFFSSARFLWSPD
jgi:hypothetical protein